MLTKVVKMTYLLNLVVFARGHDEAICLQDFNEESPLQRPIFEGMCLLNRQRMAYWQIRLASAKARRYETIR